MDFSLTKKYYGAHELYVYGTVYYMSAAVQVCSAVHVYGACNEEYFMK